MSVLLLLLVPAQLDATRFELGQRMRDFDRALAKHDSAAAIERALPPVAKVTPAFFAGQLGDAAKILDTARLTLADARPDPARLWALSLFVKPGRRVIEATAGKLPIKVERLYKVEAAAPEGALMRLSLRRGAKTTTLPTVSLATVPNAVEFKWEKLPEGEHDLVAEVVAAGKVLAASTQTISVIAKLDDRLAALKKRAAPDTIEGATRKHLTALVEALAAGKTLETNYPAHRLLAEAEMLATLEAPFYSIERPGQFWLALPGVSGSPVRVEVPADVKKDAKMPVVVALHGAGGSENMFFDGYGDGLVAKLGVKRGWLVVATRSGFFDAPDVPATVDALAKVYPIDRSRVFVVGHSMGAAQAARAAGRTPERFTAVACLGGGGGVKPTDALKKVPFFVGVGKLDFAATGAKRLADGLKEAGVEKLVYKAYENVEHLTVVQLALPEVFAFFDEAAKRR